MPDSAGEPSPWHKGTVRKVHQERPVEDTGRAEHCLTRGNSRGRYTRPTKPKTDFVGTGGVLS
jgi:hypothetical protein